MKFLTHVLLIFSLVLSASVAGAQTSQDPKPVNRPSPEQDVDTLKIDTNLVTVPVIASSRTGSYIADLKKEEFKLTEDGVAQEIAFLASVDAPFYVVLMLDTSNSTKEKLPLIQRAAIAFLDQIGPNDKVKVISFDGELHNWNDFTSDKTILRGAISKTRMGDNTRVYDAVQLALDSLRPIQQRKAIVIFTDGMDWHSEQYSFESTMRNLDESGVIVYPIRFDTRVETERLARQQDAATNGVGLPTRSAIPGRTGGSGTPTTFPGDEGSPAPPMPRTPLPVDPIGIIFGRRAPAPPTSSPTGPFPDSRPQPDRTNRDPNRDPNPGTINNPSPRNDTISAQMDMLYLTADSYLGQLADRSGGQLYKADTLASLPQAFAAIAAELRTQYLLGYYPANNNGNGAYRKIQVKTSRKDIAIRARPGYRPKNEGR
ncbi:MAG TPA: VWA domain-containing protein [Pyrinomonadaceae bacterium]|nr:VWA domain-containing protein [Pyrinomonadaceae bacterium]